MSKRQFYEAPAAEYTEVSLEKRFLVDSDPTTDGSGFGDQHATVTEPDSGIWGWMN